MSQKAFDRDWYDKMQKMSDKELLDIMSESYSFLTLHEQHLRRIDPLVGFALRLCPHRETIKELLELGNIAGAFGLISGSVEGLSYMGLVAATVYVARHGIDLFCSQFIPPPDQRTASNAP